MSEAIVLSRGGQLRRDSLTFRNPVLAGHAWPRLRVESGRPGPRLCVMSGMHVNEVSSQEAALRLARMLDGALLRGSVEILPVVNLPALWDRVVQVVPLDGKNLNFSFPGDPGGGFTPALADALLREWAGDAELLLDLHGGDLQTHVAHFIMCQMTGDPAFDEKTRRFAACFDADAIVEFEAGQTSNAGRACNARPLLGGHAVMAESGGNGLIDPVSVQFHLEGALACASLLGLIAPRPQVPQRARQRLGGVERVAAPENGRLYPQVRTAQPVCEGQVLGLLRDVCGEPIGELRAPCAGIVVFLYSHPIVARGEAVFGIGRPPGSRQQGSANGRAGGEEGE